MTNQTLNFVSSHDRNIDWILFDLGNILVELDGFPWFLSNFPDLSEQEIHRKWINLECVRLFETGKIDEHAFFNEVTRALDIPDSAEEFSLRYKNWVKGFYPGSRELLLELKKDFKLACLSNTNCFHIKHLKDIGDCFELFDKCFFSHEIGYVKPDSRAFDFVLHALNTDAGGVLFFDDSIDNINTALQMGFHSIHLKGFQSLKDTLSKQGL